MAYAQEWLPAELGSLANSSGSWTLLAFGLALLAPTRAAAAATGALVLAALLAGYVVGAAIRGDTSSTRLIVFWGLAALRLRHARSIAVAIGLTGLIGGGFVVMVLVNDAMPASRVQLGSAEENR